MLDRLFATKPPLDEPSIEWLCDVFAWCASQLDGDRFMREARLVTPSNTDFPGRADSVYGMATLIFERTCDYAGMSDWPLRLVEPGADLQPTVDLIGVQTNPGAEAGTIAVHYDPSAVNNPEVLISSFVQVLAHHKGAQARVPPPGGRETWTQTTEIIGVFLGFGLMFANTASTVPTRSCGSCGSASTRRELALTQWDLTYALALFCALKGLPARAAVGHLRSHLRPHFKRSLRDAQTRIASHQALAALAGQSATAEQTVSPA